MPATVPEGQAVTTRTEIAAIASASRGPDVQRVVVGIATICSQEPLLDIAARHGKRHDAGNAIQGMSNFVRYADGVVARHAVREGRHAGESET